MARQNDDPGLKVASREDLDEWLKGKPSDWARAIAVRAALRVFPLVLSVVRVSNDDAGHEKGLQFVILTFRAAFISWVSLFFRSIYFESFSLFAARTTYASAENTAAAYAAAARAVYAASDNNAAAEVSASSAAARAAFAAAAAADAATDIWRSIDADVRWLEGNRNHSVLLAREPLWLIEVREDTTYRANFPSWAREPFDGFAASEYVTRGSWRPIVDWYRAILPDGPNGPSSDAFGEQTDITIANQPQKFWERDPQEVVTDIGRIVKGRLPLFTPESPEVENGQEPSSGEEEREAALGPSDDFFLSYAHADLPVAHRISDTLEGAGFTVFSQFNDMTAGKSFVREMNRGLLGMGRMISVYSDDYFNSNHCMSEWEAAYLMDPSGEKGKIVPFMVKPCAPSPLAKRLVWTSLLGLSPEEERRAILNAVLGTRTPRERAAQRQAMKAAASPDVSTDASGDRLDAMANETVDAPFADIDLAHLPELLRSLIQTALASIEGKNCSAGFRAALKAYSEELAARGTTCIPGVLRGQMDYIEAELDDPDANHWVSGKALEKTLENIRQAHARLIAHYPLDQERERLLRAIALEPAKYEPEASQELRREVLNATREAYDAELVTDDYKRVVENRERVARDILDLRTPEPPFAGDEDFRLREVDRARRLQDAKKRTLAQQAGFADKSLEVLGKITRLADSPSAQRLAKALQDFADWFW
ncbi:toll/interleukin-1 receptor domain-containing protein [Stappia stellulata]|uniref:toll/interleukin-1 receptor domain-containing protein n=1 Tax=Stappia stellulata TaxID=71235 RepID=UPI001CD5CBA5|nr:toll/interleukin-1 receptor domain-containing protein [Stappia stellulata]MCA1244780.1 toll/interleukin-1 receptor domain-containing protein [Stappia stellulata]